MTTLIVGLVVGAMVGAIVSNIYWFKKMKEKA